MQKISKTANLFFCLLLLAVIILPAGCQSGKPVEIMAPLQDAQSAGGQEIQFLAVLHSFQGSSVKALWSFGDGTTATGLAARHAYDRRGVYTVSVSVTNEFATTATDNISIEITSSRYTKLNQEAEALPDTAENWIMVRDDTTGLIWEMKDSRDYIPDYANPHDADNTYTWYDDNPLTNGGSSGTPGNDNDTSDFIALLNAQAFGGFTDWRMPDCEELSTIQDKSRFNPAINPEYFPQTASWYYWTGATYAQFPTSACHIDFFGVKPQAAMKKVIGILNHYGYKSIDYHARAVRSEN